MTKFVNLHNHTTFSTFDGIGYPSDHMNFAYENGSDALAITDHGNMSAMSYQVEHYKKMKAEGKKFKAIYGIEAYFLPSLAEWRDEYEKIKDKKKQTKKKDFRLSVEDEGESKKAKDLLRKRSHLILLAQNQKGLNNLFQLVSKSYESENFYRYPRMDFEMLEKHNEGIICTSACLGGVFAQDFWNNKDEGSEAVMTAMRTTAEKFKAVFGDRFYGELQWNLVPEQHELNKYIIDICAEFDIDLVSTADAHYYHPDLWKDRELYRALGPMGAYGDGIPEKREDLKYELWPKNGDQMWESYLDYSKRCNETYDNALIKESITRTYNIAHNRIEEFLPDNTIRLPEFVVPEGKKDIQELTQKCLKGLKNKNLHTQSKYVERLKEELYIIRDKGFAKYFLTMTAIADRASQEMMTGPGRGSAAGALTAYVLNITQVDPLKYGLLFSRFLTRDSKGMPDIDFDVSRPMELKEELANEWGQYSVVPISNYNTLKLRSLIKDISKFYGIPFAEVNKVTGKMLHEATPRAKAKHGIKAGVYTPTFEEVMEFSESLQGFLRRYPHIKTHVLTLHGQIRSVSRHAGGICVGERLNNWLPLINSGGTIQTPWTEGQTVRHLEPMGFIKFDVLGLSTLEMIEQAIKNILKRKKGIEKPSFEEMKAFYNKHLHPDIMDFDDQDVYKSVFHDGKFAGTFQFTQKGAQDFCKRAKPTSIKEISNVTAIFRPGPLIEGVDKLYVAAKKNPEKIKYIHPLAKEVLKDTYGYLIYQEQIALLAHKLGKNISLDEGNILRKLLTKKGTGESAKEAAKIHDKFIEGCLEKNISKKAAEKLWNTMSAFAQYGFNLSHSICYSVISYQCAWLSYYYPSEWAASFLDKEPEGRKEKAINIAKSLGFFIEPLNINTSGNTWQISEDGKTLIQPLTSIKGLGEKAIEQITANRPFNTIEEFLFNEEIIYSKLNKKALDVLVRAQALNDLMDNRFTGLKHFWTAVAVDRARTEEKFKENIELYAPEGDFSDSEKIEYLASLTGAFPLSLVINEGIRSKLEEYCIPPISEYDVDLKLCWGIVREVEVKKTRKGRDYYLVRLLDDSSQMTVVKCWGVQQQKDKLHINRPYMINPRYEDDWGFSTSGRVNSSWKLLG